MDETTKVETTVETPQHTPVPKGDGVPEGFVTIGELSEEYPDFSKDVYANPKMEVAVWLNEEVPLNANLFTKGVVEIQNKQEIHMNAYDLIMLVGEPRFRCDKHAQDEDSKIPEPNWIHAKKCALNRCFRDIAQKSGGGKSSHYPQDICDLNDKYGFWGKIPDFRVNYNLEPIVTYKPKLKFEEWIWKSMETAGINVTKKTFTTEDVQKVKEILLADAADYGFEKQLQGKRSNRHVKAHMEDAQEEFANIE